VTAVALLILGAGGVVWGLQARISTRVPEVEVESFAVTGAGLPNTFAADVREEMLTTLERGAPDITLRAVDPGQRPTTFRLRGRIEATGGDLVNVYARLEPPDGSHILWSSHYEVPLARARPAAVGHEIIYTVGCIMHLYQGVGAPGLASPAMAPWTDFCTENSRDGANGLREIAALRRTIAIAPDFARADAMIGPFLGQLAEQRPPPERKALIDEAFADVARAERLAPRQGEGYMAEAALRQDHDPVRAEQLYIKAANLGTVGDTHRQLYANFLERMGRIDDAIEQHQRLIAVQPNNTLDLAIVARDMAVKGGYAAAQQTLAKIERERMNPGNVVQLRLQVAIWARDWPTVRGIIGDAPNGPGFYIDALASGDKAQIDAAGAKYEAMVADPNRISTFAAEALALTGRPKAALATVGHIVDRIGPIGLTPLYTPPFAEARRTPEFEAMAMRYGLMDYWKRSGRAPDFCTAPDPPALCRRLASG
jgi:hypothetical protein